MNLFKFFTLVIMLSVFAACGDDDDNECVQADWLGTYSGTILCSTIDTTGVTEDVTVTITASGTDQIVISYDTPTTGLETDPLDFNNCSVNFSASDQGITVAVTAELDGDNLSLVDVFGAASDVSTCTTTATRN